MIGVMSAKCFASTAVASSTRGRILERTRSKRWLQLRHALISHFECNQLLFLRNRIFHLSLWTLWQYYDRWMTRLDPWTDPSLPKAGSARFPSDLLGIPGYDQCCDAVLWECWLTIVLAVLIPYDAVRISHSMTVWPIYVFDVVHEGALTTFALINVVYKVA